MRLEIQPGPEGPIGLKFCQTNKYVKEGMFEVDKESKLTSPSWLTHSCQGCFCA